MNRSRAPYPFRIALLCSLSFSLPLPLTSGCGAMPGDGSQAQADPEAESSTASGLRVNRPPAFVAVQESLAGDDQNRWFDLTFALRQNFDDICGDTFCEGEFTNLASMGFTCSVSTRTGQLKTCLWLFAGSNESVTASTGNIRPNGKFFSCEIPVTGTPHALLDALLAPGGDGPLYHPLPGTTSSIYDQLGNCL